MVNNEDDDDNESVKDNVNNVNVDIWEKKNQDELKHIFEVDATGSYKCDCNLCIAKNGISSTPKAIFKLNNDLEYFRDKGKT